MILITLIRIGGLFKKLKRILKTKDTIIYNNLSMISNKYLFQSKIMFSKEMICKIHVAHLLIKSICLQMNLLKSSRLSITKILNLEKFKSPLKDKSRKMRSPNHL
jgi:hypothetical protein